MSTRWGILFALPLMAFPLRSETASDRNSIVEWKIHFQCGQQHYGTRELSKAEECYRSALVIAERFPPGDPRRGATLSSLGTVVLEQGRLSDAEFTISRALEVFRECGVERCSLGLPRVLHNLAIVYGQQNRPLEAERLLREALGLYARVAGGELSIAGVLETLGWFELNRQRPGAAESYFRRALALVRNVEGVDQTRGRLYASLSSALLELNRAREATEAAQQALAAALSAPGMNAVEIVSHACALARASLEMGDYALAERSLIGAQEKLSEVPQPESCEHAIVLVEFGRLRFFQKRFTEAAEFESRGVEILSRHLSADHPQMLKSKANYAITLRKLKRNQEAKRIEHELRSAAQRPVNDPATRYRIDVSDLQRSH